MEAAAKKILFEAVLESLHQKTSYAQVICNECDSNNPEIEWKDHSCFNYCTMYGFVSSCYKILIEEAGRKEITDKLIETVNKRNFQLSDIFTEIFAYYDPYQRLLNDDDFGKQFIDFVRKYEEEMLECRLKNERDKNCSDCNDCTECTNSY